MTTKEKAEELFYKMSYNSSDEDHHCSHYVAKNCTLIAVELHLEELSKMKLIFSDRELHYKYWQEVKQEIEKL
jgi:hypothetical protein